MSLGSPRYVLILRGFLLQVNAVAKELGIGFAGMGFDPKWPVEARPHMPKVLPAALHYCFDKPSTLVFDETKHDPDFHSSVSCLFRNCSGLGFRV